MSGSVKQLHLVIPLVTLMTSLLLGFITNPVVAYFPAQDPGLKPKINGPLSENPKRNVIITSWKSGSTFLTDILNSIDGTFYFNEPLMHYGIQRFNASSRDPNADIISHLKKLLKCDFSNMKSYLNESRRLAFQFKQNLRLWSHCNEVNSEYCFSPDFLESNCKRAPVMLMKIVRSNLELVEELLKDESLNVRMLFLVRDPRPSLLSRWNNNFCSEDNYPSCGSPQLLCEQLVSDFKTSDDFYMQYPKSFITMRYEDLALNNHELIEKILSVFELTLSESIKDLLARQGNGVWNNLSKAFNWIKQISWKNVSRIQTSDFCAEAMDVWGYTVATSYEEMKSDTFNPLA